MTRSLRVLTIAAVSGVALCGALYLSMHADTDAPPAPLKKTIRGAAVELSAELAELRQEVALLKLQVRSQGQKPAEQPRKADAQDASARMDPASDPDLRAEQERQHRDYMAGVDAAFRKEPIDATWSSATASGVRAAIATDDELRRLVGDVECRSRTCRVVIAETDSGRMNKSFMTFIHRLGAALPSVAADRLEDASGAARMILYMSRND